MLNDSVTTPLKEGDDSSETTTLAAFQSAVAKYRFNSESPVKCEGGYLEQAAKSQASKSSGSRKHKNGEDEATTKKKKKRPKRGYAEPKHYAHLNKLPDILRHGLDVLFCGIKSGNILLQSVTISPTQETTFGAVFLKPVNPSICDLLNTFIKKHQA
ncbi:hypothetical protein APHAL10511_007392 [Amanita phalloides]|nr:hypothetical protein APHAL10511_007392 [Amanita phalloides]